MWPEFSRCSPRGSLRTGPAFLRGAGSLRFRFALGIRPAPAAARSRVGPNVDRAAGWSPRHVPAPTPAVAFAPAAYPAARPFAALLLLPHLSPIHAQPWRDVPAHPATESVIRARARSIRRPRDPGPPRAYFRSPPSSAFVPLPIHSQAARARTIARTRAPLSPVAESHWPPRSAPRVAQLPLLPVASPLPRVLAPPIPRPQ